MPKHPLTDISALLREFVASSRPVSSLMYPKIADEVAYLRDLGSVIAAREDALTDSLKLRLKLESITEKMTIAGRQTSGLLVIPVRQDRIDIDALRLEFGETWYKSRCKEVRFIQIRTAK